MGWYDDNDAVGLAKLVADSEVTARDVVAEAIARIEARNPSLNAVITPRFERALEEAATASGPLAGVPFAMKDLNAKIAGEPTCYGSRFFTGTVAGYDTSIVARYRRAGLVMLGKTNTPELGLAATTEPALFGPTRNPWDPERSAGGSSGGAAAAVASGMLPAAHATDGGGSIRIPAQCCGLVGLKPTRARVSMAPDLGEGWAGLSAHHVVSRTVRDSAALLDVAAGPEPGDPYAAPPPPGRYADLAVRDPGKLRIAFTTTAAMGVPVDAECVEAARAAAKLCESLGHTVEEAAPSYDAQAHGAAAAVIVGVNTAATVEARAAELGREPAEGELEPVTVMRCEEAKSISSARYALATRTIQRITRDIAPFFDTYDVLLTPATAKVTARLGEISMDDPAKYANTVFYVAFTSIWNATGQPAMSLPLHRTGESLPVGVQFVGRFGDEHTLLQLATQLEAASPWPLTAPVS